MGTFPGGFDYLQQGQRMKPKSADGVDLVCDPTSGEWVDPRSELNRYAGQRPKELPEPPSDEK